MSVGNFTVFDLAKTKIGNGAINLGSHSFKMALTTSSQVIAESFSGSSADARYSDLTNELSGTGYSAGGVALTTSWTRASNVVTFGASDVTISTLSGTFKYLVVYDNTASNKDLLGFVDLDTSGGSVTVSAANYTVHWNASGLFTLT